MAGRLQKGCRSTGWQPFFDERSSENQLIRGINPDGLILKSSIFGKLIALERDKFWISTNGLVYKYFREDVELFFTNES